MFPALFFKAFNFSQNHLVVFKTYIPKMKIAQENSAKKVSQLDFFRY